MQLPIAFFVIAKPAGLVFLVLLCFPDPKVSHVVLFAFLTHLKIGIAVQLEYFVGWNTTFSVEAVNILRNDCLEDISVHQLLHGHVCLRWKGLLNGDIKIGFNGRLV